ncbi:MAG: SDR family oxidoreductase [Ignavibacteria bacterium]
MKTVLITGASKGIGLEAARQLGQLNYYIYLTGRDINSGFEALEKLISAGIQVEFELLDVDDYISIRAAYTKLTHKMEQLDVLINNAGIMLDKTSLLETPQEVIEATLRTNTIGPILVTQVFSPLLKANSRVINVSSSLGSICKGMANYAPIYSVSKTALNAVTIQLAYALQSKGVAVNAVCPGWVKTRLGGPNAQRTVEQGAETIVWLATEAPIKFTGKFFKDKKEIHW